MKSSPRPFVINVLAVLAPFCFIAGRVYAQTIPAPQEVSEARASVSAHVSAAGTPLKRLVASRLLDAPEGARVQVASDAPLNDYTSRLEGGNFYVLIPRAEASFSKMPAAGHGFTSAQVEQRDDNVVLSFRLQQGASVTVSHGFNRLDIIFKAPSSQQSVAAVTVTPADGAGDERETIRQMRAQIEALEARLKEVEEKQAAGNSNQQQTAQAVSASASVAGNTDMASATAGTESAKPDDHSDHDDMPGGRPKLEVQGFADVNYRASNEKGKTNSFSLGQLDLFLTSRLSDKFSVLAELILEAGQDNAFSFEIHRLLLRYAPNDYFNFSAGRYHTAIGYYNTAYHHGSWFQTAIDRPFIFAFESKGGILPLHNVGLSVTGRIPSAPFGLRYIAEVGNGRASRSPLDRAVQTAVDENNGKAFNLGLFARPKAIPGFQTGFSIYHDNLTPNGKPKVGQTIMAAHLVYQNRLYELLNEAIFLRHTQSGRVFQTFGGYTQFSRRFGNARPYLRYQYIGVPTDNPIFSDVGRRNGPSLGLRYDISDFAAFKAQYDRTSRRSLSTIDDLMLQLAFTF
jgi:hypothetical protein